MFDEIEDEAQGLAPSAESDTPPPQQEGQGEAEKPASDPYLSVLDKYRQVLSPEQLDRMVNQGYFFETDEGRSQLKQRAEEMLLGSREHLRKALERGLGSDKKLRQFAREFLGALKPDAQQPPSAPSDSYSDEPTAPPPAQNSDLADLREMILQQQEAIERLSSMAQGTQKNLGQTTTALTRAAELNNLAAQDEDVLRSLDWLIPEVNSLMDREPARFAGPGAAARAAQHIMGEARRRAQSLGATIPKRGPKVLGNGKAGVVAKAGSGIDQKKAQEIVARKDWDALARLHAEWAASNPE